MAQAGNLDPTFGTGGHVIFDFSAFPEPQNSGAFPDSALLDAKGNILIAAESTDTSANSTQASLLRFLPTGKLDLTFGHSGLVRTTLQAINAMTIQSDGKIVVAAGPGQTFLNNDAAGAIARFNSNGSVDTTFGSVGQASVSLALAGQTIETVSPGSILVEPNGKIVVTAQETSIKTGCIPRPHESCAETLTTFAARFNFDGSLDTTFGDQGTVSGDLSFGSSGQNTGFALQSDGSILFPSPNGGFTEVDVNGRSISVQVRNIIATASPNNPAILADGKVVSVGQLSQRNRHFTEFSQCTVSRTDSNGGADPTFQFTEFFFTGSKVGSSDLSSCFQQVPAALTSSGQILVAGNSSTNATNVPPALAGSFGLARLNANGGLDSSFGDGGLVTSNFFTQGLVFLLIQPDGKIVLVGSTIGNAPPDQANGITTLALARYLGQ